ncbi:MAG: hypothetical protein JXA67_19935 [Micromonosporaceae bacterium]|nr:hypothetical protein [Micromonosporaceae bacterium]
MDPVLWGLVGVVSAAILGVSGALGAPALREMYQRRKFDHELRRSLVVDLKSLRVISYEAVVALETALESLFETGDFDICLRPLSNAAHGPVDDFGSPAISVLTRKLQVQIDIFLDSLNQARVRYSILSGTKGGLRELGATRSELSVLLGKIWTIRQQLRDEIIEASGLLGHELPPGLDSAR